jgi:hypothetical protein
VAVLGEVLEGVRRGRGVKWAGSRLAVTRAVGEARQGRQAGDGLAGCCSWTRQVVDRVHARQY